jgi:acetylornithine aminotransferase/acetylornithine/N-succinyldiaminopimelate aminotransferase
MPATSAEIMSAEDRWQIPTYTHIPIAVVRGKGSYVENAEGDRYLDLYGGHCVALVGHSHPTLVKAIREQTDKLLFYSNVVYNDTRARAAAAVTSMAPEGLRRVFFCNSGTEANEAALKIARKHTGRSHVVSMADGFHGRTLGSLGATGPDKFRDPNWPVSTDHTRIPYGDLPALQAAMGEHVAAVMLEPIPSMGGIRVADKLWFEKLRELCDTHGTLLLFDEVQTGFGRTGTTFFGEQMGITPDIITAAKGVAGGVPAGLALVREDISDAVELGDQGTTFGGGPLASAAMEAVISILRKENLLANAARMGQWFQDRVGSIAGVSRVSGRGLLLGIDLDRPAKPIVAALREHRILSGASTGNLHQIRLLPPLTLTEEEAEPFALALEQILAETSAPDSMS